MEWVQPVPWTELYAPGYTRARGDRNYDFAWAAPDAQGMYPRPPGYHSAVDMFAPGNSPVRAPFDGRVVRSIGGGGVVGQVFGGTLCIEHAEGHAVQMRHVNPSVGVGRDVSAGDQVATVTAWRSGGPHAHVECYRYWPAPYEHSATFDPRTVLWVEDPPAAAEPIADFYLEELPHHEGGIGPVVVRRTPSRAARDASVLRHRALGRIITTMRDASGDYVALWWLPNTHDAGLPIFGPWADAASRDRVLRNRQANTGRTIRPFKGRHRSNYPQPA